MIDLYQFTPAFGHANLSAPCMKVEAFLRLSEIPFQILAEDNPANGPKGKLPFIRDNGLIIGDSELIMDYLESKYDFAMDGHLDSVTRANHHAFGRMLDHHLYWAIAYSRWVDEHNWSAMKQELFGAIPPPISSVIAAKVRRDMKRQLHEQGLGRHSADEIYSMAKKDIDNLAMLLDGKRWFGGDYVCKLDISAVAYLSNILLTDMPSPMADHLKQHNNLLRYTERSYKILFPDPIKERQIPGKLPKAMLSDDNLAP